MVTLRYGCYAVDYGSRLVGLVVLPRLILTPLFDHGWRLSQTHVGQFTVIIAVVVDFTGGSSATHCLIRLVIYATLLPLLHSYISRLPLYVGNLHRCSRTYVPDLTRLLLPDVLLLLRYGLLCGLLAHVRLRSLYGGYVGLYVASLVTPYTHGRIYRLIYALLRLRFTSRCLCSLVTVAAHADHTLPVAVTLLFPLPRFAAVLPVAVVTVAYAFPIYGWLYAL